MFSSNRRRASTVSDAGDEDVPVFAGIGAHATATKNTKIRPNETLVDAIQPCGKSLRNLNRRRYPWLIRSRLLADDLLEDLQAACQIVAIHDQRREQSKSVLSGCECEQTFVPAALDDLICRLDDIETPDVTGSTDRSDFS